MIYIIIFPKKTQCSRTRNIHTCKEGSIEFPSFLPWDSTNNVTTQKKLRQLDRRRRCKAWRTPEMTKAGNICSRVDISGLILKYKKADKAYSILLSTTLQLSLSKKKIDRVLDNLKCAAKPNLALGFFLRNIEDGKFRYFYAHEKNTLLEQSKLVSTKDDMAKLKEILNETDVIESCPKEMSHTKWKFFKLTNSTKFAALLRDLPMGCKNAVLPESLLKNHTVTCLTYEHQKTIQRQFLLLQRPCSPLAWKWEAQGKTSKLSNLFLINTTNPDPSKFQGVCMDDIHLWKI